MTTPTTRPDPRITLQYGNTIRFARAAVRRRVHEVRPRHEALTVLADVVEERHACLGSSLIWTVLEWCRPLREPHIKALLRHAGIRGDFRMVGDLTDRQIHLIASALRTWAAHELDTHVA